MWVQGQLVARGLARAYSLPGSQACVRALQRRETAARNGGRGIWRHSWYKVTGADETALLMRRRYIYQLVEGKVLSVGKTRGWTFLNFDADYKTDFTVAIKARDRKQFAESDITLDALAGKRVLVRGWIESWNGPAIKATHPEQIEILKIQDPAPAQKENPAPAKEPGSSRL
jgi:hypothetical protein